MIELELLALVWATQKCARFLEGRKFDVVIDHRPLLPFLNSYTLNQAENPRLLRLLLKIRHLDFKASWRKGKEHYR